VEMQLLQIMTQTANAAGLVGLETKGKTNETQQTISDIRKQ